MPIQFTLPKWYDLHTHVRQGASLNAYVQAQLDMGCAGFLAMPNTKPPVSKVHEEDAGEGWSIAAYRGQILAAADQRLKTLITPLYLTRATTPAMIEEGAKSGLLQACKYYPPHGTTGAEFGAPLDLYMENGVFAAMEGCGIVLNIHGEEHGLEAETYFDRSGNAEEIFYETRMPALREKFPKLRIVCEHVTTRKAVDFVAESGAHIGATITPQHLIYTVGHLIQGLKYHLFCLPVLKFEADRAALRGAVLSANNSRFFAGTDSAPHTQKCTPCGCAAGCYTGGIAPQLYAHGFELAGADLASEAGKVAFERFLCLNGAAFYGLDVPSETFTLSKEPSSLKALNTGDGEVVPLPLGLGQTQIEWSLKV